MRKLVILLISAFLCQTMAQELTRCQITRTLYANGFDRSLLPIWVCLIDAVSGRNCNKVTTQGYHTYYGLFQIKSMDFCTPGKRNGGGMCQSDCNNFLNNDIKDDMNCAQMILKHHGFKTWPKFETSCKGNLMRPWVIDVRKCLSSSGNSIPESVFHSNSHSKYLSAYRQAPKSRY